MPYRFGYNIYKFYYFCRDFKVPKISNGKYTNFDEIMNILDVIIILCCCPMLISGYKKGLINQIISIIALMTGIWIAHGLGDSVGGWITPLVEDNCENPEKVAYIGGFAITFVAVCLIFLFGGKFIEKILLFVIPDWINKLLGLVLAAINGILLLCILYYVFQVLNYVYVFTDLKAAFFSDSVLFPIIESTANALLPNIVNIIA